MTDSSPKPALPGFALSAGMLWLLAGALYKLFEGSPNDLPKVVTDMSPLGSGWETMRAAIIVELAVVGLVIAKPRIGWLLLAAAFGTFLAVLYPLVQDGAGSCGCFGSNVTIKPETMMAIDGSLLALILISRPWRMPRGAGLGWAGYLPLLAVAVAAPWMKLEAPVLPPAKAPTVVAAGLKSTDLESTVKAAAGEAAPEAGEDELPEVTLPIEAPLGGTTGEIVEEITEDTEPVAVLPEFFELRHDTWAGKDFDETDISRFVDQSEGAVLPNSHVVIYRQTCPVCQKHLEELWEEAQNDPTKWTGERQLVLIRVIENKDAKEENLCTVLPEPHQRVTLPALKRGYGITTPMSFDVNEFNVIENIQDLSEH